MSFLLRCIIWPMVVGRIALTAALARWAGYAMSYQPTKMSI